jgi:hypothetical protein
LSARPLNDAKCVFSSIAPILHPSSAQQFPTFLEPFDSTVEQFDSTWTWLAGIMSLYISNFVNTAMNDDDITDLRRMMDMEEEMKEVQAV